ncbi:MAG: hypothetical protein HZA50_11570 [Planctomycetes bacterium]|nr:hypothetical protein [Planctomycetota bacterium]
MSGQASIKLSGADRAWRAAVAALGQGRRAAMDGASLLQTAESGIGKTDRLLEQMRQLAQAQDILYEVESYVDNTAAA